MLRTSASVLALLLYFTANMRAQQTELLHISDSLPEKKLSEVVVSANRYGTVQLKTPDPVRVLDIKTIENHQLRTSSESLVMTPGVFVQKTNHGGGSPFLRGLTGNQTLLLVDGIRLSNATMRYGPNQYFNTIDVFSLEKIEVLRGSGSVQYGSDAIGGTIQTFSIEPKTSAKPLWGSSLLTRVSTQNMEKTLRGSVNFGNKRVAFIAGATRRIFGDIIGGDTTGRQRPTGYDEIDFDLKGRILLSSKTSLTMAYQNVNQNDVPVFHKVVLENYSFNKMDPQKRELAYIKLNHNISAGIIKSTTITASYQHSKERRELLKNGSTSLRTETDLVKSLSFSAEAMTSDQKNWSANSGIDIYKDIVNSDRYDKNLLTNDAIMKRGLYPDGATMTSIAAFSMHTFDFNHWIINAGARYNTFINKVKDANEGTVTLSPSAVVGNLAILRKLTSTSNLFFQQIPDSELLISMTWARWV
jgi:outer membrane cobalamin receptor